MKNKEIVILKEKWWESIISDIFSAGLLMLAIYVSKGDVLWTVITVSLYFFFLVTATQRHTNKFILRFNSKEELQEWLNKEN